MASRYSFVPRELNEIFKSHTYRVAMLGTDRAEELLSLDLIHELLAFKELSTKAF